MPHRFDPTVEAAVLGHMNDDHTDDNLLITRAFSRDSDIVSATMTGFDGDGGMWAVTTSSGETSNVRIPWPGGAIAERLEVRREVVALYDEACRRLGVEPRPHG